MGLNLCPVEMCTYGFPFKYKLEIKWTRGVMWAWEIQSHFDLIKEQKKRLVLTLLYLILFLVSKVHHFGKTMVGPFFFFFNFNFLLFSFLCFQIK